MTKTIVITGASSGIGRAAAVMLADQGHLVFATARRMERLVALAAGSKGRIVPVQMDVRDVASIGAAVEVITSHVPGGVDVLINNAGYSLIGAVETLSADDVRDQYETNVLGLIEVTRAFLPAMRARQAGRVVNVSSVLGRMTFAGSGVYCSTKYAVEALSDALRMELAPFGIDVAIVEPAFTATEIDTAPNTRGESIADYEELSTKLAAYNARETAGGADPAAVAAVVVKAATSSRPRTRYVVPRSFTGVLRLFAVLPTRVSDSLKLRQL